MFGWRNCRHSSETCIPRFRERQMAKLSPPRNRSNLPCRQRSRSHRTTSSAGEREKAQSLKRHLMTRDGLTPDEYLTKWGLPRDPPWSRRITRGRGRSSPRAWAWDARRLSVLQRPRMHPLRLRGAANGRRSQPRAFDAGTGLSVPAFIYSGYRTPAQPGIGLPIHLVASTT